MNYIWGAMILIGIAYGAVTGNMSEVTNAALDSAKEAVTLCIAMLGVMALWTGLMEVARSAGIIQALTKKITPFIHFMFPKIPKNHPANEQIAVNVIANILGLGWAATPAGLSAMKELKALEEEREKETKSGSRKYLETASDEMCTFLVLNISSLQLIPVNIIAYRSQYGSVNPTAIMGPGLFATFLSTLAGILFCRLMVKKR